jgi:hypothetical protein
MALHAPQNMWGRPKDGLNRHTATHSSRCSSTERFCHRHTLIHSQMGFPPGVLLYKMYTPVCGLSRILEAIGRSNAPAMRCGGWAPDADNFFFASNTRRRGLPAVPSGTSVLQFDCPAHRITKVDRMSKMMWYGVSAKSLARSSKAGQFSKPLTTKGSDPQTPPSSW